jgi:muramoyltetrapeptide carboxypeptidase
MPPFLKPRRLRRGDVVGVAALSGPVDREELEKGCRALEEMGYVVRQASNLLLRSGPLGLAGSDAARLAGYRDLLLDPDVAAILFARGGYGVTRILPHLSPGELAANAKIHCGFSDVTALSAFLLSRCGLPSFHGPMVAADLARGLDPVSGAFFPSQLEGNGPPELALPDAEILVPGAAQGRLVGGCLSLLAASVGTADEFDYDGALLFLEEVNEEAYRVDRMLAQLARARRFDRLGGILMGSMASITFGGVEDPVRLREVLAERLGPLGVPVVLGLPCGHRGPNVALPVGGRASWNPRTRTLRFEEEILS